MSKSKATTKASKATDKVLSKVKDAGVTKASQSPKAKSKEVASKIKAKEEKAARKKKEPTPSSSSESESDSDEEMKEDSSSSESESESEAETKKPAKATKAAAKEAESSESESESSESESESESEEEAKPKKADAKKAEPKKAAKKEESSESESESDSEDSESDEEEEEEEKAEPKKAAEKEESSDSSDSSDSDEGSDSSDEEEEEEAPKKRKAEDEAAPSTKKAKTEVADNSPNLFAGNLSWNVDEEWLRREFEEFGELAGVRIMTERETGRSRGFGYVEYVEASSAKAAYEAKKDTEIDGRTINLDYAKPRDNTQQNTRDKAQSRARSYGDQTSPESSTLFIGNLSFSTNEDVVRETFQEQGTILGIRLPTDAESGRPKGFGYIEFSSVDEARQALNDLQGADVGGRAIRLDYSTPRPQGDGNRGGRGGFGGRGGGGRGGGRGRGGFGGRGRGGPTGANSTNRGGFGDYSGKKTTFD